MYYNNKSIPFEDNEHEEFLEHRGYLIEPSFFIYDNEEEKEIRKSEWLDKSKQFYKIPHNGKSIFLSPTLAGQFEENIMKYIEFEFSKLESDLDSKAPTD